MILSSNISIGNISGMIMSNLIQFFFVSIFNSL